MSVPGAPVAMWQGLFGTAAVVDGEPEAVTSDGTRHKL